MVFQQFTFPQVIEELQLTLAEADLFGGVPTVELRADFVGMIQDASNLASAINTEKARSEFVIAPVLFELRRRKPITFGLFSGVELEADTSRGLNGVCDFLLTRSPRQHVMSVPILTVVEAKNENLRTGLGQCIASMTAAVILNREGGTECPVYGAVTTGSLWKFLKLEGLEITLDVVEYHIDNLAKIVGILERIVTPTTYMA
jgi:hypothetical protein